MWFLISGVAVLAVLGAVFASVVLPEVQKLLKLKEDVVRFQKAAQVGPGAFTPPTDLRAAAQSASAGQGGGAPAAGGGGAPQAPQPAQPAQPGTPPGGEAKPGTFGGTGSNRVCDRERLIKFLAARPDQLREWAKVLGIEPTREAVAAYIRELRPVTLTKDTQVTNHSYKDGKANPYQSIMQKGTAVLVDKDGKPVTRCRCGNPLTEPVELEEEPKCVNCPANYQPPPPCDYYNYDDAKYARYDDQDFQRENEPGDFRGKCYRPSPAAPPVEEDGEPPPDEDPCVTDPTGPGCQQQCQNDPTLPYCNGAVPNGEETPTDGEEAPPDGQATPPDGQTAPPEDQGTGGEASPSGGQEPPPAQ